VKTKSRARGPAINVVGGKVDDQHRLFLQTGTDEPRPFSVSMCSFIIRITPEVGAESTHLVHHFCKTQVLAALWRVRNALAAL